MKLLTTKPSVDGIQAVWLDSSVIIKFAHSAMQKPICETDPRYRELCDLLIEKVAAGKVVCPKGEQYSEYYLGIDDAECCRLLEAQLSDGYEFISSSRIHETQLYEFVKSRAKGEDACTMSYRSVLSSDSSHMQSRFLFLPSIAISENDRTQGLLEKEHTFNELSKVADGIKQRGTPFRKQLEYECSADAKMLAEAFGISNTGSVSSDPISADTNQLWGRRLLSIWENAGGIPSGPEGLFSFMNSDEYKSLPYVNIRSTLLAAVTTESRIQSGDAKDVIQLSAVLPYCDYVITDKKMKARLETERLADSYGTKVRYVGDWPVLGQELAML